jgi:hypothetical protein
VSAVAFGNAGKDSEPLLDAHALHYEPHEEEAVVTLFPPSMLLPLLALAGLVIACEDNHLHARGAHGHDHIEKREYPQFPLIPPYRPLVWGDFNVIHTTDTHGWLLGHQKPSWPEPNYRCVL